MDHNHVDINSTLNIFHTIAHHLHTIGDSFLDNTEVRTLFSYQDID
jgi:hypothetical protein